MPRYAKLTDIKTSGKRQRRGRDHQDHQDLFVSISESEAGLIHAPLIWQDGDDLWLVAGEGRLKVISEMYELGMQLRHDGAAVPEGMVPYTLIGGASALGRFEAEFDENIRRVPLSVAERAAATAELFELKKMKAERDATTPPTITDLALELRGRADGDYRTAVKQELIVARHLDDPDVASAKTMREAFNVVKKKETQRKAAAIAKEIGVEVRSHGIELINADAMEWLKTCRDDRFDIVLTDPPYGMGADGFGEYNSSEAHGYDDSLEAWTELMRGIIPELARVCAPDAHLYLFCDFDRFHTLKMFLATEEWKVHRTPLIWHNPTGFRTPWPEHGPQRKYECILYARRGNKKVLKVAPDVLSYSRDKASIHPAQKPVALLADLLSRSALPSDSVLDFCSGSAATGAACFAAKLPCVCIEKDPQAYALALQRIQQVTKGS